jgi:hypothetical protein
MVKYNLSYKSINKEIEIDLEMGSYFMWLLIEMDQSLIFTEKK